MQLYVMKQKGVSMPQENYDDVIAKNPKQSYFEDIMWTYSRGKIVKIRKQAEIMSMISNAPSVVKAMNEYIDNPSFRKKYEGYSEKELMNLAAAKVNEYASEM